MDQLEAVRRYLAIAAGLGAAGKRPPTPKPQPFITISREAGAGGRALAKGLLEAFAERSKRPVFAGWEVFDRELCERVAGDPDLHVGLRGLLDESSLNAVEDMVGMLLGRSPQQEINQKVIETVRELALVGKAIIVGRAGACTTRDLPLGIHLRLVAPLHVRVAREASAHSVTPVEIEAQVAQRDYNRSQLVRRLCKHEIDDPLHYDAVWNTERAPLDVIVDSVVSWIESLESAAG